MSWRTLEQKQSLKPFTEQLLADSRTLWFLRSKQELQLDWHSYEEDTAIFLRALQLIWNTRATPDTVFITQVHPQVLTILSESEIFKRLSSTDIVVTKGHQGVVPYRHTINVMEVMAAESAGLTDYQVFILRLAGYFHDAGKAISEGIPHQEVQTMIAELADANHSYPNHDLISVLVLEAFSRQLDVQKFISVIGQQIWQLLLLVVHNHHFLDINKTKMYDNYELHKATIKRIVADPVQMEALLLTFAFGYADIMSNKNYHYLWPEKMELFEQLFEVVVAECNQQLLALEVVLSNRLRSVRV